MNVPPFPFLGLPRETLNNSPAPIIVINISEPPYVKNGSAVPVKGISPTITMMFNSASVMIIVVAPKASSDPNGSGVSSAMR